MKLPIVKPLRLLNVILSLTIFVMLYINRDRFMAMLHPKAKEAVGILAPDIGSGAWINSAPLSLHQLRGKVVVIDFWSFKCDNCLHVLPTLNDWYKRYKNKGVVFIAVHTPETNEEKNVLLLQRFVGAHGIEFPVVTDNGYAIWNLYHVQFWPSTFIIDRQGVIRKFHYGELGFSLLEDDIKRLLGS